jgi:WD40 repeat protein
MVHSRLTIACALIFTMVLLSPTGRGQVTTEVASLSSSRKQDVITVRSGTADVASVAFIDNDLLVSGTDDGTLAICDLRLGKCLWKELIAPDSSVQQTVYPLETTASGLIATSARMRLWLGAFDGAVCKPVPIDKPHDYPPSSIGISRDGGRLVTSDPNAGCVTVWNVDKTTGAKLESKIPTEKPADAIALAPPGNVAVASCLGLDQVTLKTEPSLEDVRLVIRVWDVAKSPAAIGEYKALTKPGPRNVVIAENGKEFAELAVFQKQSHEWTMEDMANNRRPPLVQNRIDIGVRRIADGHVVAWHRFDVDLSPLASVAISRDFGRLAALHRSGLVVVWDLRTDRIIARWRFEPGSPLREQIAFSPDASLLACPGSSGRVHVMRLEVR